MSSAAAVQAMTSNAAYSYTPPDTAAQDAQTSQARMEAEGRIARERFEREARNRQVSEDLSAQSYGRSIVDDNIYEYTHRNRVSREDFRADAAAAELIQEARTNPERAAIAYDAAYAHAGRYADELAESVATQLAQDEAAADALAGMGPHQPVDADSARQTAEDIVAGNTSQGLFASAPSLDVESMTYEVAQLAVEDPALANEVRRELSTTLSPTAAAQMNRMISGDTTVGERLEIAAENPIDGAIGFGKGAVNTVTTTAQLVPDIANMADTAGYNATGAVLEAVGADEWAQSAYESAAYYDEVRQQRDYTVYDYDNLAQQGGATAAVVVEVAGGLASLGRAGITQVARRADDIIEEAVPVATGASLLPTEGDVGTYRDLINAGTKGDNITPHHIPSANRVDAEGIDPRDGIAINMEQPHPGTGGRHRETFTYGTQADADMSIRDAIAAGVRDVRQIYQQHGLYDEKIREALQDLIEQNRTLHPEAFGNGN